MSRKFRWIIIIVAVAASLYSMLPLNEKVNLGLDLQGGMHVVLSVDTEKALEAKIDNMVFQLRRDLQSAKIPFTYVQKSGATAVTVGIANGANNSQIEELAADFFLNGTASADKITFNLDSAEIDRVRQNAVLQSLEVIRNRIDEFGVTEPIIQRQGDSSILVQLAGITDPDRAMSLIGQTAQLYFYLVDDTVTAAQLQSGVAPYDSMILYEKRVDKATGAIISNTPIAVKREALLTGDSLISAQVQYGQYGEPVVGFEFDAVGARIFSDITEQNVGKRFAIVLDNNVYSAPVINEKIPGGKGMISGSFGLEEAQDLAIVLRAGSLPAPVKIEENRTVGASLGTDSIQMGVRASIIGMILISIFMLIYYKLSGLVSIVGLVCNFIMLLGALCALGATLTLPGIAGVILTLGIAVDSNVLIFERVREELRHGRTVLNAFEIGYHKAFATIVDASLTSILAALVLFQFGTGPVKGFAVTLSLGLLASMFTAVFITRTIFLEFIVRKNSKTISI